MEDDVCPQNISNSLFVVVFNSSDTFHMVPVLPESTEHERGYNRLVFNKRRPGKTVVLQFYRTHPRSVGTDTFARWQVVTVHFQVFLIDKDGILENCESHIGGEDVL